MRTSDSVFQLASDITTHAIKQEFARLASKKAYLKKMTEAHRERERCTAPDIWMRCHVAGDDTPN